MPDVNVMTGRNSSWLRSRIGHLTGSNMGRVVEWSDGKIKRCSEKVQARYMREIVMERMTDIAVSHYVNDAMVWGQEQERYAKQAYEEHTKRKLEEAEFILHPNIEFFGGTPDALVLDGGVEFKCPTTTTFIEWLLSGAVPDEHKPQMCAYMIITARGWWDFCAFDPRVKKGPQLFIRTWRPTVEEFAFVINEAQRFLQLTEAMFRKVVES